MELKAGNRDEKRLVTGCRNNETWAQKQVYDLYAPAMLSVCIRYVIDKETARDILQEGFIKVFTKINTYAGTGSFGGWIRRVIVTTALEHLRQNDALRNSESIDEYNSAIQDETATIIESISANDLLVCISGLPTGYRTIFNMYAIEGYSHSEIAGILNISENTSRSQFMRARKLLQKSVLSLFNPHVK
ncbi:MAG TPA: sigma-70 family RNA polymerase sigma factor [Paludibacter sp.]|nr:sigma-70 family RNA polymerase sigma factor [Paludibacter sp.]